MRKAYIYINYPNIVVLQSYLEVVQMALKNNGYECVFIKSFDGIDKESLIVYPMGIDAFKYYWKGYKNFILWQQGATADESFMRNHSKLRYWVLNMMDVFAMKKAKFVLFVSEYMRKHYENLSGIAFTDKSYVMPCFNEIYDESVYEHKDYSKKVFTYVGSLDLWQCFDETAALYKQIEERIPDAQFKVLTFNVDMAKAILKKNGVKNYSVCCVPKEMVKRELLDATYGFIIRKDNIVNRVATPTKFSSYLASGVIPIYSYCLKDFASLVNLKYAFKIGENFDIASVVSFVNADIDKKELQQEYKKVFSTHYSRDLHISNLTQILKFL